MNKIANQWEKELGSEGLSSDPQNTVYSFVFFSFEKLGVSRAPVLVVEKDRSQGFSDQHVELKIMSFKSNERAFLKKGRWKMV